MFFSIVMPVFNGEHTLAGTCQFLKAQTFADFEVIIVNDGSTDKTLEVANQLLSDTRFKLINSTNGGVSKARNLGAQQATADYILFLDCDDEVTDTWLADFKSVVEAERPNIVFCGVSFDFEKKGILGKINFLAGTFCICKMLFFLAGGYDEQLKFSENTELGWRIMDLDPQVGFVNKINFRYKRSGRTGLSYLHNRIAAFNVLAVKHAVRFQKQPLIGRTYYQIAAVDNIRLGHFSLGRKLMWRGFLYQPANIIGMVRVLCTLNNLLMKSIWKPSDHAPSKNT